MEDNYLYTQKYWVKGQSVALDIIDELEDANLLSIRYTHDKSTPGLLSRTIERIGRRTLAAGAEYDGRQIWSYQGEIIEGDREIEFPSGVVWRFHKGQPVS